MKSSIKKNTFKAIYRLLDKVSPINGDCGLLCGSICCTYEYENTDDSSISDAAYAAPDCCGDTDRGCQETHDTRSVSSSADGDDDFSLGIYLLPGEEKLFSGDEEWLGWSWAYAEDYEFPDSWHGKVYFLRCLNAPHCDRAMRPLQCRTFPLAPHLDENGELCMIYQNGQIPYTCPLITDKTVLSDDFVKATCTVWKRLIEDPLIYDLVEMDSDYRIEDGEAIEVVCRQSRPKQTGMPDLQPAL